MAKLFISSPVVYCCFLLAIFIISGTAMARDFCKEGFNCTGGSDLCVILAKSCCPDGYVQKDYLYNVTCLSSGGSKSGKCVCTIPYRGTPGVSESGTCTCSYEISKTRSDAAHSSKNKGSIFLLFTVLFITQFVF